LAARATLYLHHVLRAPLTITLSSILGNDEIESQLKGDRLMAKNEIKMLLLGAGESGKVRRSNPHTDHRGLNAFSP
jgi:hypothetical protein